VPVCAHSWCTLGMRKSVRPECDHSPPAPSSRGVEGNAQADREHVRTVVPLSFHRLDTPVHTGFRGGAWVAPRPRVRTCPSGANKGATPI
jgi:hypothetical protein